MGHRPSVLVSACESHIHHPIHTDTLITPSESDIAVLFTVSLSVAAVQTDLSLTLASVPQS